MTNSTNPAITQAIASVAAATPRAVADPARPIYHFAPPAYWMNDPNGTIYHNGYYHLFYQHNPYGEAWGHMHWGHARSKDLVHWEQLPIALWPSLEMGEEHVFSGCAAVNGEGTPMLFYTSVKQGGRDDRKPNEQWAAIGDPDWITWQKAPANPILALENHGGPPFGGEWRDPFIFHEAGRTFMVVAGDYDQVTAVALYEATDASLTQWRYRKQLYQKSTTETRFLECPNFFKVGDKWVLLTSPYRTIEYVVGDFDVQTLTFTPQHEGVLDPGVNPGEAGVPNFYASNILYDEQGRCILLGWVRGFAPGRGWNGALALPRVLTIGPDGRPQQTPIAQLQQLRAEHFNRSGFTLENASYTVPQPISNTIELSLLLQPSDGTLVVRLPGTSDDGQPATIRYDGTTLDVLGTPVALRLGVDEPLKFQLFLDRSVLELFVNGGRVAVTRLLTVTTDTPTIEIAVEAGSATVISLDLWQLRTIW